MTTGTRPDLSGPGAAYVRVSTDQQDTLRQKTSIGAFEKAHGVTIPEGHRFEDQGWARDAADRRPEFQRLMALAEAGKVRWVVVDALDRFGTKDPHQLVHYLYRLREAGCRLFEVAGAEWTRADIATIITAVVRGEDSRQEQDKNSKRVLGAQYEAARRGEWQGGPPPPGFDVACYSRATGEELWRFVCDRRQRVYADGTEESRPRTPPHDARTEMKRLSPCRDERKLAAVVEVFGMYAKGSYGPSSLARHLHRTGVRNSEGGRIQGGHVERMLRDPAYIGYPAWNRRTRAKFNCRKGGKTVATLNHAQRESGNDPADWVRSERQLYPPVVDPAVFDAVQAKLRREAEEKEREGKTRAPLSPEHFLRGLVRCGHCQKPMDVHTGRRGDSEYYCSSYQKSCLPGSRAADCGCLRNGVYQGEIEPHLDRWLAEAGDTLDQLKRLDVWRPTDPRAAQADAHQKAFYEGFDRLLAYLAERHPEEYAAILRWQDQCAAWAEESVRADRAAGWPPLPPDPARAERFRAAMENYHKLRKEGGNRAVACVPQFVRECLDLYRERVDPTALDAEIAALEAELAAKTDGWRDLPKIPLVRKQAEEELSRLAGQIEDLQRQREDLASEVENHYLEMETLELDLADALTALRARRDEHSLRVLAQKLKKRVEYIDCFFVPTGDERPGKSKSRLAKVVIQGRDGQPAAHYNVPATRRG
jgi:DNA invertase Pin-like site-specific DNA recombinase